MKPAASPHPAPDVLRAFALGELPPARCAALEGHLRDCPQCARALAGVPDDTLLGKLRDAGTPPAGMGETINSAGDDLPPELVNHPRYLVLRKLGGGGMGTVYQAVHRLMERGVALKVINPTLTRHPVAVQRFLQEVKAAARLHHPNIVAAHDAEQVGDLHFLVMEYVEGVSLDRLVQKRGRLPADQACHFIRQAALGLQHAHDRGMVHRDIKPQNLMVTRKGLVKVLDFGLARIAEEAAQPPGDARPLTALGTVLGTPDYIAPEQVSNSHTADGRADVYSLGCTLYFLLAGRPPFPEGSAIEKALSHVDSLPTPLRTLRPDVPADLCAVVDRMMAKRPDDRFQTPGEVAEALRTVPRVQPTEEEEIEEVVEAVEIERPRPRRGKRPRATSRLPLWIGTAVVGVVLLGLGVGVLLSSGRNRPETPGGGDGWAGRVGDDGGKQSPGRTPRVLIVLPPEGLWWPDYAGFRDGLQGRAELVVASTVLTPIWPSPAGGGEKVTPQVTLAEARTSEYDAVVFSGGESVKFIDGEPGRGQAVRLIEEMKRQGKVVGGLCRGAAILAKLGALKGKQATGPGEFMSDHLKQQVGGYVADEVVVDGQFITGRDPQAARPFAERLLGMLKR